MSELINFRIVWEALTTCPGNCDGCNIIQKTNLQDGLWNDLQFQTATRVTKKFLKEKKYTYQKLFLTAGDYLYVPEDKMAKILDYVDSALDKDAKSRIVLFTTSAIGKPEFLKERVDIMQKLLLERNLQCFPEIVFDFAKIAHRKYWSTYIDNMQILSRAFPVSAINIQVGADTFKNNMTQKKLQEFINYCGISRVEFVITPHASNSKIINEAWNDAILFLQDTVKNLDINDKSFINPQVLAIQNNLKNIPELGSVSMKDEYGASLQSYHRDSISIANNGDLSLFFSGISNIYPLSYAIPATINIFNKLYIDINRDILVKNGIIFNNRISMQNKCSSCKFQKNCHSMGNMLLIHTLEKKNKESCPLGIYEYLKFISKLKTSQTFHCEALQTINTNYKEEIQEIQCSNPSKLAD